MGYQALATVLDAAFQIGEVSPALPPQHIKRAVAEQAVELRPLRHRVAGVIFALLVGIESEVLALPVFFFVRP